MVNYLLIVVTRIVKMVEQVLHNLVVFIRIRSIIVTVGN